MHASTAANPEPAARFLARTANWLIGIYLVVVVALMVTLRVSPGIGLVAVVLAMGIVVVGRGRPFIRDWGPFVVILIAWEGMRDVASAFGQAVQSDSVIAVERALFAGGIPSVEFQRIFFDGTVRLHDYALTTMYASHFVFPLAFAYLLWRGDRRIYYRFVITLLGVSFAAFLTFLLLPVAPPRLAFQYGEALPVTDIMAAVAGSVDWDVPAWMYRNLIGNPVAAFPSMHAAFPFLVLLFLRERSWKWALAWAPVTGAIWFATVYLGHHYVVDVLGGVVFAVVGYLVVKRVMRHDDEGTSLLGWRLQRYRRR